MSQLLAYHGSEEVKERYLQRVRQHRALDQIVKGQYWEDGKGCAVGCVIHSSDHTAFESELGVPAAIAHLVDGIFENLPNGDAMAWPETFLEAIPDGADLSMVVSQFLHWLLIDEADGLLQFAEAEDVRAAIQAVGDCYARRITGDEPTEEEWQAAGDLAQAARAAWVKKSAEKLLQLLREAPVGEEVSPP